ncbi:hypothetical protein Y032_0621g747 [Ancylostoma ceylanicum]|uniref:Leucine Rich repeat-containing domain protein n=1 Tax=Ancylostoma ceylanicum TaxID=53326 RepID=A0A016WKZ4_9BILA|nr:hypothetical protein Y032_0621g747 [Ancylostoma ceylanicum]
MVQCNLDQFSGLKDLHQLFLESNKITDLVDGVFEHLSNLKKLVLDGNKIKFRKGMFTGLDSLEELSLDNCGIENLDVNAFEALPQLKKLSLRGNPFTEIPRAVNSLDALEDLDISNTNIAEFHAQSLMDDRKLKQLYMSDMPFLYAIQDCAFCGLEKLELLHMNNCTRLHEIHPNAFGWSDLSAGRVSGIKHFYVEHCKLQTISEDLLPWDTDRYNPPYKGGAIGQTRRSETILQDATVNILPRITEVIRLHCYIYNLQHPHLSDGVAHIHVTESNIFDGIFEFSNIRTVSSLTSMFFLL